MAKEQADSDSDGVELISHEQFIHSIRAVDKEEELSNSEPISEVIEGHAQLPPIQDEATPYIPCQIEDLLFYKPTHSLSTVEKYFKKCREILKKRKLGRWEKEFLMKLLERKKQDVKNAEDCVFKFKDNFNQLIQKGREEAGKLVLSGRLKKKR